MSKLVPYGSDWKFVCGDGVWICKAKAYSSTNRGYLMIHTDGTKEHVSGYELTTKWERLPDDELTKEE